MTNFKTLALSALMIPALAACGTGYTNNQGMGYGYDRDNVEGHNVYMKDSDSYMNYQMRDTHCDQGMENCNVNHPKMSKSNMSMLKEGMRMPDGGTLMKSWSEKSYGEATKMAQMKCSTAAGINIWSKRMWEDKYVVKYTCFN